ncbi:sulfurtransferase [Tessaracoccus antarcticus]|uniref:Sulfurtransferase n=1 Tax=Tessaracoccus antarcticus TaxID=2479848 RepID=A0A3M0G6L5_9ACTN|nr:sulfurtransferase [Tessaracoccus antarcticus]RMB60158.1 sulfurtransferase [Tessaracoccus antarcticus]
MDSHPLITPAELSRLLADSSTAPVVLDIRWSGPGSGDGREAFQQGHIPGAHFVDMDTVLADPSTGGVGGRHPLPAPERFESGMRAAGVAQDRPVVVYDDWRSISASRAWWLLRHFGHDDVTVLDGGWGAWRAAGLPVETGPNEGVELGEFVAGPPRLAELDADGASRIAVTGTLIDARPANRFRGEDETVDPVAGHIPGARSLPALELVGSDGTFLSAAELRTRFAAIGVDGEAPAAAYCGSGVQACHMALGASVAGLTDDLGLYAGSWSDWITDPDRPVATG